MSVKVAVRVRPFN